MQVQLQKRNPILMDESIMVPLEVHTQSTPRQQIEVFKFKRKRFITIERLVEESCPQILTKDYQQKYRKEMNKGVFEMEISSQYNTWTILKRIEDFIEVQQDLRSRYRTKVMGLPVRKESDNVDGDLLLELYEVFLQQISKHEDIRFDPSFLLFIEQPLLWERRRLKTYHQTFMKKRSGGHHNEGKCQRCTTFFGNWKKRCFTITSEGIFYSKSFEPDKCSIRQMIPFSFHFSIEYGLRDTGSKLGIILNSFQRVLWLFADDFFRFVAFVHFVKKALSENHYLEVNRFGSFARIREECHAKFYVDGQQYFGDIYHEIMYAKRQVFITDWMLTPYFVLVRPKPLDSDYRLDKVLKAAAERGVRINILVFQEPKLALNNDSEHTKQHLESLHTNIKVMRHPKYILIPFLWSHHQKMVIIDQKIGFLGGLDLCYGRFDNQKHLLTDLPQEPPTCPYWQGADYANIRISDIYTPRQYQTSMIDRHRIPRMPWHDIGVKIIGDSVIDLTRHFVQYWNFVNFQTKLSDRELLIQAGITQQHDEKEKVEKVERLRERVRKFTVDTEKSNKLQDLVEPIQEQPKKNPYRKMRSTAADYSKPTVVQMQPQFRSTMARQYSFSKSKLEDIAGENESQKKFYMDHLAQNQPPQPTIYQTLNNKLQQNLQKLKSMSLKLNPIDFFREREKQPDQLYIEGHTDMETVREGRQRHQILRSASTWGMGIAEGQQEKSIYKAYIELIEQAKEFIYIENQFFISVENKVCQALADRINKAYQGKEKFKVMVIVPLMPGFEGEIDSQSAAVLKLQLHLQYQTISRGPDCLFNKLAHIPNIGDFIQFYGLRTHALLNNRPVTEIVYVHSKLLIVDDRIVLVGSANINDRSLLGTRDSEIAVVVEDQEEEEVERNGESMLVSKAAHDLRVKLYVEHFGITTRQAEDCLNEDVWWLINQRAKKNTLIYREIFACYPDDEVRNLADFKTFYSTGKSDRYELLKELIVGNAVDFPRFFMESESLELRPNQKEFYVPAINFT